MPGKNLQGLPNLEGLMRNFSGRLYHRKSKMMLQAQKSINVFIHTVQQSSIKLSLKKPIIDMESFQLKLNEYPQRALLLANSNDYVILPHYPDKDYFDYLINIGIGTQKILIPKMAEGSLSDRVLNDEQLLHFLKKLGETEGKVILHPYVSTQAEQEIAKKINATVNGSPPNLTKQVYSKIFLRSLLPQLALPVPEYKIANSATVLEIANQLKNQYQKIIIIGDQTHGGMAIYPITDEDALDAFNSELQESETEGQFIVEKMYDVLYSPNIQYQISSDSIQELGITDQLFDDKLKYRGNIYPSCATQLETVRCYSRRISEALQSQGYRGLLGIDLIETTDGNVFVVDINGRANASSFGLNVLYKLFPNSYPQKHLRILTNINLEKPATFTELKDILGKENIFTRQVGQGILPYNLGLLQWEKFSVIMIADTQPETDRLQDCIIDGAKSAWT